MAKQKPKPKPNRKTPRPFMERDRNSEIDERAGKLFLAALPDGWVENTLHKDYAKDHHIEKSEPVEWEGRLTKQVTGKTIYVQRKGVGKADLRHDGTVVAFEVELRYLNQWFKTPLPVFLVIVDVTSKKIYWLFIQRYLAGVKGWREQASFTVHIPVENELSNFRKFDQEVEVAVSYMRTIGGCTVRERVNAEVEKLQKKDPRFRVTPRITGEREEYTFIVQEPLELTLSATSNSRSMKTKFEDLLDRGIRVDFAPGEAVFTGSPLFEDFATLGGGLQVFVNFPGTVTLTFLDKKDQEMWKWQDLPGQYQGGRKELRFTSNLPNSPFGVKFGPIGQALPGAIDFFGSPAHWINQPLLAASYFDQVYDFYTAVVNHPRLRIEGYREGNLFFGTTATLRNTEALRPTLWFLGIMRKARQIAKHFGLDPLCTEKYFNDSQVLQSIEITHDVLFENGGYKQDKPKLTVTINAHKSEAPRLLETERELHDLKMYKDENDEYDFLGIPIKVGAIVVCLTRAKMMLSTKELRKRIRRTNDTVEIEFSCSEESEFNVRKATPEEMAV